MKTADPDYQIEYAIKVAADIAETSTSFREAVNYFFDLREKEVGADLSREREIVLNRRIGDVNESIADACIFLDKLGKPFPSRDRFHLEVGCGMGFELAASSKSYFGKNVIGLDLSPHYLPMTRLQLSEQGIRDVDLICANICDGWPIPIDKYDVGYISMEGVLEHIKDVDSFFQTIKKVKSFPLVIHLTVPYRWTLQPESHFNVRGVGFMPKFLQDRYVAMRLGERNIDHVELYTKRSLRKTLERYFAPESILIDLNNRDPRKAHYLRCVIYVEDAHSFA
ncbi:class I SAM-dependent methyltransferase [Paraburkholderia sp. GAS334]|uniref:class I SAM-dependent methyltransferase n=1 Tax=Paraburkholderia sp. GAS334 TaxID=3035131 RepID=UPI003D1E8EDB